MSVPSPTTLLIVMSTITISDTSYTNTSRTCPDICTCKRNQLDDVVSMDCKDSGLTAVPSNLPNTLLTINLHGNRINDINNTTFISLDKLERLDLSFNDLKKLDANTFKGLSSLVYLDLSLNEIALNFSSISNFAFQGLEALQYLDISYPYSSYEIRSKTYPDKALSYLTSLTSLRINVIENTPFGEGFNFLRSLTNLTLPGPPKFGHINRKTFANLANSKLTGLFMGHCSIRSVEPGSLSKLAYLRFLDLAYCSDLGYDGFQNLTFGLYRTKIDSINATRINKNFYSVIMGRYFENLKLTNLTHLDLSNNVIVKIESDIANYLPISLKVIHLEKNYIATARFLKQFYKLVNLEKIYCSYQFHFEQESPMKTVYHRNGTRNNSIIASASLIQKGELTLHTAKVNKTIQKRINSSGTTSLAINGTFLSKHGRFTEWTNKTDDRWLQHFNKFTEDKEVVLLPPKLREIYASHLKLMYPVPPLRFSENIVEVLDFSSDGLTVCLGTLGPLHHLKTLKFSDNSLMKILPSTFTDMPNLQTLYLDGNLLRNSFLQDKECTTFSNLKRLHILDLRFNGIEYLPKCTFAKLYNLKTLLLDHNSIVNVTFDISTLSEIEFLNLAYNQINALHENIYRTLDERQAERGVPISVSLEGNSLRCGCQEEKFLRWMFKTSVNIINKTNLSCIYINGSEVKLNRAEDLLNDLWFECRASFILWTCVITYVGLCLILSLGAVLQHKKWTLRYLYYIGRRNVKPYALLEDERENFFDVYISFADRSSHLVQKLESQLTREGYKVYIPEVSGQAGRRECVEIVSGIEQSACMLVFLTQDYDKSYHRNFEFNIAVHDGIGRREQNIIIVIAEPFQGSIEEEILLYLNANPSYALWDWNEEDLFKELEMQIGFYKERRLIRDRTR